MPLIVNTEAVTDIAVLLHEQLPDVDVYKYQTPLNVNAPYIVVNNLPFTYINDLGSGIININVHVANLKNGLPNIKALSTLANKVLAMFSEETELCINKRYYTLRSSSTILADEDDSHFINLQLDVIFNNVKL